MISAITPEGRVLTFEPVLRPVVALKSGKTRGSLLDRTLYEGGEEKPSESAMARLSPYDLEQVDQALLKEGLKDISVLHGQERSPILFTPVAFATLASPRGRRDVLGLIAQTQLRLGARVVLEVTHLDPGLPPSRLVQVLTLLRPTCRTVFARLKPERRAIMALADCTLAGAAIEAAHIKDPQDEDWLTRVRLVMQTVGPRLLLHNLRSTAAINAAHAAGVNYASLDRTHMGGMMPELPQAENKGGGRDASAAA